MKPPLPFRNSTATDRLEKFDVTMSVSLYPHGDSGCLHIDCVFEGNMLSSGCVDIGAGAYIFVLPSLQRDLPGKR
jgi:hypothetical protein